MAKLIWSKVIELNLWYITNLPNPSYVQQHIKKTAKSSEERCNLQLQLKLFLDLNLFHPPCGKLTRVMPDAPKCRNFVTNQ
jgi:hypothetical protein